MSTQATTKKIAVTCPKCNGSRYFDTYAHIASGVCFCCGGTGLVDANMVIDGRPAHEHAADAALHARQQAFVKTCTVEQLRRASFDQLWKIHSLGANMVAMGDLSRAQWAKIKREIESRID